MKLGLVVVAMALSACGDNVGYTLSTPDVTVAVGQKARIVSTEHGPYVDLGTLPWTMADGGIASASADETVIFVKGLAVGSTELTTTYWSRDFTFAVTVTEATDGSDGSDGSGSGSAGSDSSHGALLGLAVDPPSATVARGIEQAFTATGFYADGTSQDITSDATWSSSDPSVASLAGALADGVASGSTTITATYGSASASALLQISAAAMDALAISPSDPEIQLEQTQQMVAIAHFDDGTTSDVTQQAAWQSSAMVVASSSSTGDVTGLEPGSSTITATLGSLTASTIATVDAATLVSVAISPDPVTLQSGSSIQLHATGVFSDDSTRDITATCAWSSSATLDATVLAGLVVGLVPGSATITATCGSLLATADVTVDAALLQSITVSGTSSFAKAAQSQLAATAHYSDGSTSDITASVLWTSDTPAHVVVSNLAHGLATGVGVGTATITATQGSVSGSEQLTVTSATLMSIAITPATTTLPAGTDAQLTATATYSDATTADVTQQVLWTSNALLAAIVTNGPVSWGDVHGVLAGDATITATLGAATATATVHVTAALLQSIQISPISLNVAAGLSAPLVAVGVYSDGSHLTVTTAATWSSDASGVAVVSNALGLAGVVTARVQGTAHISATIGPITATITVTVGAPVLQSISIAGLSASLGIGQIALLTATAHYSDATLADVTTTAAWASSNPSAATISAAGQLVALGTGSATITATLGSIVGSAATGITTTGCHVLINEFSTGSLLQPTNQFVELYNPCPYSVDMSRETLVYRGPLDLVDTNLVQLAGTLAPGAYSVYGASGFVGTVVSTIAADLSLLGGGVAIRDSQSLALIDSVGYGTALKNLIEGLVALAPLTGGSLARLPNGADTNNNAVDFARTFTPTPGAANH